MTKDQINERCSKITEKLGSEAWKARYLCIKYKTARMEWRKDSNDSSKCYRLDETGEALEEYCRSNKQIRAEIENALQKVEELLREDRNDPETKNTDSKREIAELKAKIAAQERKKSTGQGLPKWLVKVAHVLLPISLVVAFTSYLILDFAKTPNIIFNILQGTGMMVFWASLIVSCVVALGKDKVEREIAELESKVYHLEKDEKWHDNARCFSALSDKESYEMILKLIDGYSVESIK